MRDQWRADDANQHRDRARDRVRDRSRCRLRSPSPTRRGLAVDRDLKGRDEGTLVDRSSSQFKVKSRGRSQQRGRDHTHLLVPQFPHEDKAGLRESKRARDFSEERLSERNKRQQRSPPPTKHQRIRSISSRRDQHRKSKRGTSRSPKRSGRSERLSSRHRARAYSPRRSPTRKITSRHHHHRTPSPRQQSISSYVPSSHQRRSRSPARTKGRDPPRRRLSPSLDRRTKDRYDTSLYFDSRSRRLSPHRHRKSATEDHSRRASPVRNRKSADLSRRSPSVSKAQPYRSRPSRRSSNSPTPSRSSRQPDNEMRSTRPIQSILEDDSRPPSPPRPIPSFDADNSGSVDGDVHMREAFPMHGMKSVDMQSTPRSRRLNIDTRQSYATSPQYMTSNSSHHGSPQSASPFGSNRGGWGQQQQQFHGQQG